MPTGLGAWSVRRYNARVQKAEAELARFCIRWSENVYYTFSAIPLIPT
jgi:hypothetical protein